MKKTIYFLLKEKKELWQNPLDNKKKWTYFSLHFYYAKGQSFTKIFVKYTILQPFSYTFILIRHEKRVIFKNINKNLRYIFPFFLLFKKIVR